MTINTVLGSVTDDQKGIGSLNEYVRLGLPGWDLPPENDYNESVAFRQAKYRLLDFKKAGGSLIVDNSGIAMGRRADFLQALSRVTGVHIVPTTGFPDELGTPGHFYPDRGRDADYIARLFTNELNLGMVTDGMTRTNIKPGLIRTGYRRWPMAPMEEMCHRAAARASKKTGVSIYSWGNQTNIAALELLLAEGAVSERIVIGHCDDGLALNSERDVRIAKAGAYVAYDSIGWEDKSIRSDAISDDARADLVVKVLQAGFKERILLSAGSVGWRLDHEPTAAHGYDYLITSFLPRLRTRGVSDADIKTMLEDNPRRVLSIAERR